MEFLPNYTLKPLIWGLTVLLIGMAFFGTTTVAQSADYELNSDLWFEGTSTVRDWACKEVPASASTTLPDTPTSIEALQSTLQRISDTQVRTVVRVPVKEIRCEQGETMNKHMRNALKAQKYPEITFDLTGVNTEGLADTTPRAIEAGLVGNLTIKDTTRSVEIPATLRVTEDGLIRVNGDLPLDMTNYTVEPPTVMWSITVYDDITIHVQADFKPAN